MSIEDRVRELNGGTYTKKSYSVEVFQYFSFPRKPFSTQS